MAETEITQTGNQSILLTNLQKLEGSGKVGSPVRDISAKDIVSGIISAANQKMLRAGKSGKKDSVDSANRRFSEAVSVAVDTAARIVDSSTMTTSLYEKPGWSEQQIVVKTESAPVLVRPDQPVPTALNQVVDAPRVHDENVTHKSASFENSRCSNRPDQDDIPVAKEVELEMKCEDDATPVFKVHVEPVKSCQQSVSGMRPIVKSESVPQQMSNLSSTCYTPVYENISRSREYLTTGEVNPKAANRWSLKMILRLTIYQRNFLNVALRLCWREFKRTGNIRIRSIIEPRVLAKMPWLVYGRWPKTLGITWDVLVCDWRHWYFSHNLIIKCPKHVLVLIQKILEFKGAKTLFLTQFYLLQARRAEVKVARGWMLSTWSGSTTTTAPPLKSCRAKTIWIWVWSPPREEIRLTQDSSITITVQILQVLNEKNP